MRTFSCFTTEAGRQTPTLSFIFAAEEERARKLARRELTDVLRPVWIEGCENGKVLWTESTGRRDT